MGVSDVNLTTKQMALVSMFAALTAVGAFIKIPVPYIPFTLQFFFVILAGLLLGSRLGLLSQIIYIAVGLSGLPVFASGGGIGYVAQPTFGYLLGFAAAAFVAGRINEKYSRDSAAFYFVCCLAGLALVYVVGALYLYLVMNYLAGTAFTVKQTLWFGVVICLPGDLLLCAAASSLVQKVAKRVRHISGGAAYK
ncbi:substrate-specific component BioY [Desulfocucumis palustris]|uniref:Biotin transporter n=1 Tax=Desulfocucumis palustris TaxID=1898651 RepID=A0A2L2XET8_9FIRM|nr:ECF transporter S component [Desulfocucumis palustris]GBF34755.1 substrate-specific component BioY [Desulfocucumis palustris]